MPHPKHRSHYSQVFYVVAVAYYRCRQILIPEKKAWQILELRNIATPHLLATTANATDVITIGKQDMECAMVCAIRQ